MRRQGFVSFQEKLFQSKNVLDIYTFNELFSIITLNLLTTEINLKIVN